MAFTDWLREKDDKFAGLEKLQEPPGYVAFREAYAKYGKWGEVLKAASWPEGGELKKMLTEIENRFYRNEELKVPEWHMRLIHKATKKIIPKHGKKKRD
jgi:hypothetical protein